jgi:2-polyprenyl-6-methoxyphenol hydroxylase-like FAD-dependent oxidoreductase
VRKLWFETSWDISLNGRYQPTRKRRQTVYIRHSSRNITADHLVAVAQRVLHPHTLEAKEIAWKIGQRLCDKFDDVPEQDERDRFPHVFIAGDACHTHSPKAGQGMNVSMQDGFNLGWKLASVTSGRCTPQIQHSYSGERRTIVKDLIVRPRVRQDVQRLAEESHRCRDLTATVLAAVIDKRLIPFGS